MELKIIVLGSKGCSGHGLVSTFCSALRTDTQIYRRRIVVDEKTSTLLKIYYLEGDDWDHAWDSIVRAADGIMLVYNITKRGTLYAEGDGLDIKGARGLGFFMYCISEIRGIDDNCAQILVGNKCHKGNKRQVTYSEASVLANDWKCPLIEVSTKQHINHEQCFINLVQQIVSKLTEPRNRASKQCSTRLPKRRHTSKRDKSECSTSNYEIPRTSRRSRRPSISDLKAVTDSYLPVYTETLGHQAKQVPSTYSCITWLNKQSHKCFLLCFL